jgi:hypothetical protein
VAHCVTCGTELHPERAEKDDYCLAPECQKKNLKSLAMVAVGVNKSAEQYLLLDDETRDDLARGKYHDQRRASFGTSVPAAAPASLSALACQRRAARPRPAPRLPARLRAAPGADLRRNWPCSTTSKAAVPTRSPKSSA